MNRHLRHDIDIEAAADAKRSKCCKADIVREIHPDPAVPDKYICMDCRMECEAPPTPKAGSVTTKPGGMK